MSIRKLFIRLNLSYIYPRINYSVDDPLFGTTEIIEDDFKVLNLSSNLVNSTEIDNKPNIIQSEEV